MKAKRFFLLLTVLSGFLIGCTKTNGDVAKSKSEMLINKKWQLVSLTSQSGTGVTVINGVDSFPSYRRDDYLLFKSDSTYEYNDNLEPRPGLSSKIIDAGDWQLARNNTALEMHSTIWTRTYPLFDIMELTDTKLKMQTKSESDGSLVVITFSRME
ncbi:MAG TPA: DUF5004 domain-containing protein [Flavitalea sp.]|nr:DUF5004 domain-containing protein [Flavitalea sp.]